MHLYVEGGGDSNYLRAQCRQGFRAFLLKAGLKGKLPRIVACGGRLQAYNAFCTALRQGEHAAILLIDSEEPVTSVSPWTHLLQRKGDGWPIPAGARDDDCHLMVQCMENWFLADRAALVAFFRIGFDANKLPSQSRPIEGITKHEVYDALRQASSQCKSKGPYRKGDHSFGLLSLIDAGKVVAASPWASRLIAALG